MGQIPRAVVVVALSFVLSSARTVADSPSSRTLPGIRSEPASGGSFQLVGQSSLLGRGMNAALAIFGRYAYVGSRTDGTHPHAGVLVVDIARLSAPRVVGEIGPPNEGN